MDENDKICWLLFKHNPKLLNGILKDFISDCKFTLLNELNNDNYTNRNEMYNHITVSDLDVTETSNVEVICINDSYRLWLDEILYKSDVIHNLVSPFRRVFKTWQEHNINFKKLMDEYKYLLVIEELNLL